MTACKTMSTTVQVQTTGIQLAPLISHAYHYRLNIPNCNINIFVSTTV